LHFTASPVSGFNRFVAFRIAFRADSPPSTPLSFSYAVECSGAVVAARAVRAFTPVFAAGSNLSAALPLFTSRFVSHDTATLTVALPAARGYRGVAAPILVGATRHTAFHCYFRLLFSLVELSCAVLLAGAWRLRSFAAWPPEQQLAFALLAVASFANNPLYSLHALHPSRAFAALEAVAAPLLHAHVCATALASLRRAVLAAAALWPAALFAVGVGERVWALARGSLGGTRVGALAELAVGAWTAVLIARVLRGLHGAPPHAPGGARVRSRRRGLARRARARKGVGGRGRGRRRGRRGARRAQRIRAHPRVPAVAPARRRPRAALRGRDRRARGLGVPGEPLY
jgi:hypothetical protein